MQKTKSVGDHNFLNYSQVRDPTAIAILNSTSDYDVTKIIR